jgi:hypothetical protein
MTSMRPSPCSRRRRASRCRHRRPPWNRAPIYQALKAADEVAAALQAHLIEEHQADLQRAAAQSTFTNSLKLLRQARERLG